MVLKFDNEAPGVWAAHDETGDYEVRLTRTGTHVHMEVHGPAGDQVVDQDPRDSMAGFDLCQAWWARVQQAIREARSQQRSVAA